MVPLPALVCMEINLKHLVSERPSYIQRINRMLMVTKRGSLVDRRTAKVEDWLEEKVAN